jgi:hypothetical protein
VAKVAIMDEDGDETGWYFFFFLEYARALRIILLRRIERSLQAARGQDAVELH